MRDEQVRRYARHILLPDFGGLGQTALLGATAVVDAADPAAPIAASFLAAGGVGTVALRGATPSQLAAVTARGPDCRLTDEPPANASPVLMPERPVWWPAAPGDELALAFWRGGVAATRWMATVASR
jgi:hypothetical protein